MHVPKWRSVSFGLLCLLTLLSPVTAGCVQTTPRVVRIGLVAPFEGRYREIGVDIIPAARLAIREWAAQNGSSSLAIELVAYDDAGDAVRAAEQAHKLTIDPDVEIVVGHWLDHTTQVALPVYEEAGLPLVTFSGAELSNSAGLYNLSPSYNELRAAAETWVADQGVPAVVLADGEIGILDSVATLTAARGGGSEASLSVGSWLWGLSQFYGLSLGEAEGAYFVTSFGSIEDVNAASWTNRQRASFVQGYIEGSLGAPPGPLSVAAYEATWVAILYVLNQQDVAYPKSPVGDFEFDSTGRRVDAPIYVYKWQDAQRELVATIP